MKMIEVDDEVYELLRQEAERRAVSVAEVVRQKVEPEAKPWRLNPEPMGAFKIPPEKWREVEDEGRAA